MMVISNVTVPTANEPLVVLMNLIAIVFAAVTKAYPIPIPTGKDDRGFTMTVAFTSAPVTVTVTARLVL